MAQPEEMCQCQMVNCGCVYDPDRGDRRRKIPKGTAFKDLPDDGDIYLRPTGGGRSTVTTSCKWIPGFTGQLLNFPTRIRPNCCNNFLTIVNM